MCVSISTFAQQTDAEFAEYVSNLKQEALQKGFQAPLVERAFANLTYKKKAVTADRNQPETKLTLDRYLATRVPDWKVQQAVEKAAEYESLLSQVEKTYGVQKRFIVALWGNESNFGRIQGSFPVVGALVTLAFDGRREAFFKQQLFAALTILEQGHVDFEQFTGSWAGAMGQTQFIPTSFLNYAVDFDQDGKKDIWSNPADVFASIANYLSSEGWQGDFTWGRQVSMPDALAAQNYAGLSKELMQPLSRWQDLGVRRYDGSDLPDVDIKASLIMPDGEKGRIYLVYNNFHTLMRWNRSSYFGVSVGYLSDRIKRGY
nr:lytic murein transglycosylase [Aestuariibacter salexigens]